jgi:hypothetical protein
MCKNCVHHRAELRDHQYQSPHICFSQPLLVPKCIIQPENFLLLLCVLIKNNVQQSWERWSIWSIWWSILLAHSLLQFNSFNTHCWVIPPQEWKFHPIISVNPTNLMGSSFCYSSNLWLMMVVIYIYMYVCFWSFILPPHQIEYKFSSRDQIKMHHITRSVCVTLWPLP